MVFYFCFFCKQPAGTAGVELPSADDYRRVSRGRHYAETVATAALYSTCTRAITRVHLHSTLSCRLRKHRIVNVNANVNNLLAISI